MKKIKNHKLKVTLFIGLLLISTCGIAIISWLMFSDLYAKSWNEIKLIITTSIISYFSWILLIAKTIIDIVVYFNKIKKLDEKPKVILVPKKPLKQKPNEVVINGNYVSIDKNEITIRFNQEFKDNNDFYNNVVSTSHQLSERIRKS